MIALVRKNLACSISSYNPFKCKSPVPSALSFQVFSTSPKLYDLLLHKHHFSLHSASLIALKFSQPHSPEKAESVLSFLKESGCSIAQLEKIVKYKLDRILLASVEDIKFKIKVFQDVGLSSEDVAKMVSSHQVILHLSAKNKIIPSLSLLKRLLVSDYNVARVLRKSGRVLSSDLERTLMPNIELLKSYGIPMERILWLLYIDPRRLLIKPDVVRKSVDKAKEMGVSPSSNMFLHAVRSIASMGKEAWEVKLQDFRNMGFSEHDMLTMFQKAPNAFDTSVEKVEKIKALFLATGKFSLSRIVNYPASLTCNFEKRCKPRLRILGTLESKNLIENWPALGMILSLTDAMFSKRFIKPYLNEVGDAFVSYVEG